MILGMRRKTSEFVIRIREELEKVANPANAPAMAHYMRDQFPFLGVTTPERRAALRRRLGTMEAPNARFIARLSRLLWAEPDREFQYVACDLLARWNRSLDHKFLSGTMETLITSKSWWDSVDGLRPAIMAVLLRDPSAVPLMYKWIESDNIWLVRSALIHQLTLRGRADRQRLFDLCSRRAADAQFFMAKAVGWALRDYSYVDPKAVLSFVANHAELSALARRESLKAIKRNHTG